MISNRKESFRFEFEEHLPALFKITEVDHLEVSTSKGDAQIINLSPHGIKLNSNLTIPEINHKTIQLSIAFTLNNQAFNVTGEIIWMKNKGVSSDYGIDLNCDEATKHEIIKQLKIYSKKIHGLMD